jgi:hypothetical protein
LRLYPTKALAITGGASSLNPGAAANASTGIVRDDSQYIKLNSATNTSLKIFAIRYVDDTAKRVMLRVNVTGLGAGSTWAIGGRVTAAGAVDLINALSCRDTLTFNTDISAAINATFNNVLAFTGHCRFVGKAGARRVFANTGNGLLIGLPASGVGILFFENLEMQSQGTGGVYQTGTTGSAAVWLDTRVTDSGTTAIIEQVVSFMRTVRCEFSGSPGSAASGGGGAGGHHMGSWFHDNTGSALTFTGANGPQQFHIDCIFERNASNSGAVLSSSGFMAFASINCVYYHNDGSGLRFNTSISPTTMTVLIGTIFKDNGNAATEMNFDYINDMVYTSRDNCFNISGGRGGINYHGAFVPNSTDITTDPQFDDPDNGTASLRDFKLVTGSPGKTKSFTLIGSSTVIHYDMGAAQGSVGAGGGFLGANKNANMEGS